MTSNILVLFNLSENMVVDLSLLVGALNVVLAFFAMAFIIQYIGLLAERWFFFAQANHPQNLYYQTI